MEKFNLQRFGHLIGWQYAQCRRDLFIFLLACFFAFFFGLNGIMHLENGTPFSAMSPTELQAHHTQVLKAAAFFAQGMWALMMTMCIGVVFGKLKSKTMRTTHLMLPGTRVEKFLLMLLYGVVINAVLLCAALVVAEGARYVLHPLFAEHYFGTVIPYFFDVKSLLHTIFDTHSLTRYFVIFFLSGQVWTFSCYLVGSVLFRNNSWILTSAILFFVMLQGGIAIENIFPVKAMGDFYPRYFLSANGFCLMSGIMWALAVLNVGLTYVLYKRLQVVQRKWINL